MPDENGHLAPRERPDDPGAIRATVTASSSPRVIVDDDTIRATHRRAEVQRHHDLGHHNVHAPADCRACREDVL